MASTTTIFLMGFILGGVFVGWVIDRMGGGKVLQALKPKKSTSAQQVRFRKIK